MGYKIAAADCVSPKARRGLFGIVGDHGDCLAGIGVIAAYIVAKVWGIAS